MDVSKVSAAEGSPPADLACRVALERALINCQGKTPEATMASALYTDVKRKGDQSVFTRPEEGLFGLREWEDEGFVAEALTGSVPSPIQVVKRNRTPGARVGTTRSLFGKARAANLCFSLLLILQCLACNDRTGTVCLWLSWLTWGPGLLQPVKKPHRYVTSQRYEDHADDVLINDNGYMVRCQRGLINDACLEVWSCADHSPC